MERLPPEILNKILKRVDTRDLVNVGRTSRYLHQVSQDPRLWRTPCLRDFYYPPTKPQVYNWREWYAHVRDHPRKKIQVKTLFRRKSIWIHKYIKWDEILNIKLFKRPIKIKIYQSGDIPVVLVVKIQPQSLVQVLNGLILRFMDDDGIMMISSIKIRHHSAYHDIEIISRQSKKKKRWWRWW